MGATRMNVMKNNLKILLALRVLITVFIFCSAWLVIWNFTGSFFGYSLPLYRGNILEALKADWLSVQLHTAALLILCFFILKIWLPKSESEKDQ